MGLISLGLAASLLGEPGRYFGASLARIHDVDGDGVSDLAVGDPSGFYGGADEVWIISSASGAPLGRVRGELPGFGGSVHGGIDLDGGGIPDLLIGATGEGERGAAVVALSGESADVVWTFELGVPGSVLSNVHGVGGGLRLEPAPDLDGDGIADVAVSVTHVKYQDSGAREAIGWCAAISGATGDPIWQQEHRDGGAFGTHILVEIDPSGGTDHLLYVGAPAWPGDKDGRIVVMDLGSGRIVRQIVADERDPGFGASFFLGWDVSGGGTDDLFVPRSGLSPLSLPKGVAVVDRAGRRVAFFSSDGLSLRQSHDTGASVTRISDDSLVLTGPWRGERGLLATLRPGEGLRHYAPPGWRGWSGHDTGQYLFDGWGCSSAAMDDLDGDGRLELAVGSVRSMARVGEVWIVSGGRLTDLDRAEREPEAIPRSAFLRRVRPTPDWYLLDLPRLPLNSTATSDSTPQAK